MKRLLCMLSVMLCMCAWLGAPLAARADGPRPFEDRYLTMSAQELAASMEAAMTAADLPGASVCTRPDGSPAITQITEQDAFCVARRPDGLLTLCCFIPKDGEMALAWHNDLLLSYYQELSMSTEGAAWSGGVIPEMVLTEESLALRLPLWGDVSLLMDCTGYHSDWVIDELGAYVIAADGSRLPLLVVTEDNLDGYARLSNCHPGNWTETEDGSW